MTQTCRRVGLSLRHPRGPRPGPGEEGFQLPEDLRIFYEPYLPRIEDRPRVILAFPKEAEKILLSGMLEGAEEIAGKPVVIDCAARQRSRAAVRQQPDVARQHPGLLRPGHQRDPQLRPPRARLAAGPEVAGTERARITAGRAPSAASRVSVIGAPTPAHVYLTLRDRV